MLTDVHLVNNADFSQNEVEQLRIVLVYMPGIFYPLYKAPHVPESTGSDFLFSVQVFPGPEDSCTGSCGKDEAYKTWNVTLES